MNMAQQARLRTIDCLLDHFGHFNRAVLEDYFGLSTPQVSHDIREYLKQCPQNATYCKTTRRYIKLDTFQRQLR